MFPLALIPLAMKAAEGVPALIRLLKGDKAGDVAERVVGAAKALTGHDDPETAVQAVTQDPELMKLWIAETHKVVVAELEAETERMRTVNETMRAEYASDSWFVKCWRPFYGYCVATSWTWFMGCAGYVLVTRPPAELAALVTAIGGLMPLWGIALSVLGVAVHQRTQDKRIKAGVETPGLFGSALAAVTKARS